MSAPHSQLRLAPLARAPGDRVAARAAARIVAERLAHEAAAALGELQARAIVRDPSGAPAWSPPDGLHLSLAHSSRHATALVSRLAPVGVDVERIDSRRNLAGIADIVGVPPNTMPPATLALAVHAAWALREAIGKSLRVGIWAGLDELHLDFHPIHALPHRWRPAPAAVCTQWSLAWAPLGTTAVIALAIATDDAAARRVGMPDDIELRWIERD